MAMVPTRCYVWVMFAMILINNSEGLLNDHKEQVCPRNDAVLGTEVHFDDVDDMLTRYETIEASLVANGVVVIRNQTMNRVQQNDFTGMLGSMITFPKSFEGQVDPEPGLPNIQRATSNYFHNGTWKGVKHCFGCYWHKDANFYSSDYVNSMLYAEKIVGQATPTYFLDNCVAYNLIPPDLKTRIQHTVFRVSVRDIPDFRNGTEEDFALFPDSVLHPIFYTHPSSGRRCLYMTRKMVTLRPKNVSEMADLQWAWDIMISQAPKYHHYWTAGDIVIWDNLAVMHRSGVKRPGYSPRDPRILIRTLYLVNNTTKDSILTGAPK